MKIGINLLPPEKKAQLYASERFRSILGWEAVIFLVAGVFFGFIFCVHYLLSFNLQLISATSVSKSNGAQYETIKYYESKFSEINSKISKISSIASGQIYWSELFLKLNNLVPDNVEISGMSSKDYALFLAGKAKTREDLLVFKDNLSREECFESVNLPLSDLVSKENIAFQIDLEIKKSCIKNK